MKRNMTKTPCECSLTGSSLPVAMPKRALVRLQAAGGPQQSQLHTACTAITGHMAQSCARIRRK